MGASVLGNTLFDFKINREKHEEMHLFLVADYCRKGTSHSLEGDILPDNCNKGHIIFYSKRLSEGDIYYKMTYQENGLDELLYEDTANPEIFNRFVENYETDVLNPAGSLWQEIKPLEVRMQEVVQEKH